MHKEKLNPISTQYNGITFRSRTEARWAIFLQENNIPWEYESEGYELRTGRYLPDFYLPEGKCFVEVKADEPAGQEIAKAKQLAVATGKMVFIAPGGPRAKIGLYAISPSGEMQRGWQFTYAHEQGVGYLCDDVSNYSYKKKLAHRITEQPGMYGYGADRELEAAGKHWLDWRGEHHYQEKTAMRSPVGNWMRERNKNKTW